MRQQDHTPIYIVSAHQKDVSDVANTENHDALSDRLTKANIAHQATTGCYEGEEERSFVVKCNETLAITLGRAFHQESILFLDNQRNAFLLTIGYAIQDEIGYTRKHIGTFKSCTEEEARAGDTWTRLGEQYYHVV